MLFDRLGITYKYEYPLAIMDRGRLRLWYPDYQLTECGAVIEYAGVNGNEEYDNCIKHKKSVYAENSIPVIFLYSDIFKGYWPEKLMNKIRDLQKSRIKHIDQKLEKLLLSKKRF